MMIEFWWKVLIASIITAIVAKFFGSKWDTLLLFAVSFIGWAAGLILLVNISNFFWERRQKRRK